MIVTLSIFSVWNGLAFKILLFLAGLQKINKQVYQAARIDGSSPTKTLFRITLPLLSPTIWMVILVSVIYVARTFNEVYAMFVSYSGGAAGSGNAAITIMYYIYWMFYDQGKGQLRCGSRHSVSDRRPSHHGGTAGGLQEICPLRVREGTR